MKHDFSKLLLVANCSCLLVVATLLLSAELEIGFIVAFPKLWLPFVLVVLPIVGMWNLLACVRAWLHDEFVSSILRGLPFVLSVLLLGVFFVLGLQ